MNTVDAGRIEGHAGPVSGPLTSGIAVPKLTVHAS
jgi:hypothetical protein